MSQKLPGGLGDFNSRLQAAMEKAKSGAKAVASKATTAATAATGKVTDAAKSSAVAQVATDEFSQRVAAALGRASGTPVAEQEGQEQEQQEPGASGGPVGVGDYLVKQGDCMASIAVSTGHFWETIWTDPANSELNDVRQDPYILLPGDRVTIPELRRKDESIAPEQRHRFKRRGCPEKLVIFFRVENEPRANQRYVITIDGVDIEGTTDPNGRVEIAIPPNAQQGKIVFPDISEEYELELGRIDPITEVTGVKGRLHNLGFYDGPVDPRVSPEYEEAIQAFQVRYGLDMTGEMNDETRGKLQEIFGS